MNAKDDPSYTHAAHGLTEWKPPRPREEGDAKARCPYCKSADLTWASADLRRGRRDLWAGPGIEYHCYASYVID